MLKKFKFDDKELYEIWSCLYKDNELLTPYSSYEFSQFCNKCFKFQTSRFNETNYFFVYYDTNSNPKVLMPITVKKDVVYFYGEREPVGALDFVYGKMTTKEDIIAALFELKKFFSETEFILNKIHEKSLLNLVLNDKNVFDLTPYTFRNCVNIDFGKDYDAYYKRLTKSNRQNLRTSYNRITKSNKTYSLKVYQNENIPFNLRVKILELYFQRRKEQSNIKISFLKKFTSLYKDPVTKATFEMKNNFISCLYIDGELSAFLLGMLANDKSIMVPKLAINSKFFQYSPGKILINESIKYLIDNGIAEKLDLSRGDEQYKFDMGGEMYISNSYKI